MSDQDLENLDLLEKFEVGANFFELIEFSLIRRLPTGETIRGIYGVNVAKVREVVLMPKINPLGATVAGISGIFEIRGVPIPAINLCQILGDAYAPATPDQQIIVTEFSAKRAGFIVSSTHRIRRVGWDKVLPPSADQNSFISGMIIIENNEFLFILDLEKILADIEMRAMGGSSSYAPTMMAAQAPLPQPILDASAPCLLLIDDSKLILNNIGRLLTMNGYRVAFAENGAAGFKKIEDIMTGRDRSLPRLDIVVSDVEMPQMDGITLVRKLRENNQLRHVPIILHTSLSGKATQAAGESVGADAYVVKNNTQELLDTLSRVLVEKEAARGA